MIYPSGALTIKFIMFQFQGHLNIRPEQRFIGMATTKVLPRLVSSQTENFMHKKNPQVIPAIHGRPEIPSTSLSVRPPPSITRSALAIQHFAIQSSTAGVISPVAQMVQYPGMIPSPGMKNPRQKVVPPNVTVVSQ